MTQDDIERYQRMAHAMQSGVKMLMNYQEGPQPDDIKEASTSPKHLRTGVNSAMCDHAALVEMLVEKGIITPDEYQKAIADQMEAEVHRYERHVSDEIFAKTGNRIEIHLL